MSQVKENRRDLLSPQTKAEGIKTVVVRLWLVI